MIELLWLLLPVAAASGWWAARRSERRSAENCASLPGDYIKGLNFLLNEQPDKALEVFVGMVDVDSETVETHLILGSLFRRRGEVDRAIRIHQNLIARPNLDAAQRENALLELGKDYMKAGLLDRAEGLFRELKALGSRSSEVHVHLRDLYEQEKEWEKAIEAAQQLQVSSEQPQFAVIAHYHCELAEAAARRGESAKASQLARRALSHDHNCIRASLILGDIDFDRGDYKAAIKSYRRALAQDPDHVPAVLPKIKTAFEKASGMRDYVAFLQELHRTQRSSVVTLALVEVLRAEHRLDELEALLEEETRRDRVSTVILKEFVDVQSLDAPEPARAVLRRVGQALGATTGDWLIYRCGQCGFEAKGLLWQCPSCHGWGSLRPVDRLRERSANETAHLTVI